MKAQVLLYRLGDVDHCKADTANPELVVHAYSFMRANFPENQPRLVEREIPEADPTADTLRPPRSQQVTLDDATDPFAPESLAALGIATSEVPR